MKTVILFLKCFLMAVIIFKNIACNFAPGSYPYAEIYEINSSEQEVKNAIYKFKEENLDYNVPKVTITNQGSWDLIDESTKNPEYWYKFYFYYKEENKIVFTWIRSYSKNKVKFAFVSINNGLDLGKWKYINKDFSPIENKNEKKKFEERILNKILEKL